MDNNCCLGWGGRGGSGIMHPWTPACSSSTIRARAVRGHNWLFHLAPQYTSYKAPPPPHFFFLPSSEPHLIQHTQNPCPLISDTVPRLTFHSVNKKKHFSYTHLHTHTHLFMHTYLPHPHCKLSSVAFSQILSLYVLCFLCSQALCLI